MFRRRPLIRSVSRVITRRYAGGLGRGFDFPARGSRAGSRNFRNIIVYRATRARRPLDPLAHNVNRLVRRLEAKPINWPCVCQSCTPVCTAPRARMHVRTVTSTAGHLRMERRARCTVRSNYASSTPNANRPTSSFHLVARSGPFTMSFHASIFDEAFRDGNVEEANFGRLSPIHVYVISHTYRSRDAFEYGGKK